MERSAAGQTSMMAEGIGGALGEPVAHRTRGALEELPRSTTITLHQTPPGETDLCVTRVKGCMHDLVSLDD